MIFYTIQLLSILLPLAAYSEIKIAYTKPTGDYWQIWVYDMDSKQSIQITKSRGDKSCPYWSRDGARLIYKTSNGELYMINLDGTAERQIAKKIEYIADPAWVDENIIIITRYRTDIKDDSDIWQVDLTTEKVKVLVSGPGLQYHPSLNREGTKLVYISGEKPNDHQVCIKDLGSGKSSRVTHGQGYNAFPKYSPDGMKIVFVSNKTGDYELWLMDNDGKNQVQLTHNEGLDTYPVWSSDGRSIIYNTFREGKFQIWRISVDGADQCPVITEDADCRDPAITE